MNNILVEDKDLNNFKQITNIDIDNYLISENGILYNNNTNNYIKPSFNKRDNAYSIELIKKNKQRSRYQIKYLLYITFIDNDLNIQSKDIIINNTNDLLLYINFTINDLKLKNSINTNNNIKPILNTENDLLLNVDKDLSQFKQIPIDEIDNYLMSERGIIYNTNTKNYMIPRFNKRDNVYIIDLTKENKERKKYQIKYLLYITFINNDLNIQSSNIIISKYDNNLKYINFTIYDLNIKSVILKEDNDLNNFKLIPIDELNNYLISEIGIVYNSISKQYLIPYCHKNTKIYTVHLNKSHYQVRHLLYITFIDNNINIEELRNVKSKFMINIKNTNEDLKYINFTINDLELITKSEKLKLQNRNNRIINKYNSKKEFITSYTEIEDIRIELGIKYNKYITLACSKNKDKLYNNYYFRYDDDDEIKNPDIIGKNEVNINGNNDIIRDEEEVWKQLNNSEYNEYYSNYEISNYGNYRNIKTKNILKPHVSGNYYYANINIYNKELNIKQVKKERINKLVADNFLDKPENISNLIIDHIDGNKSNNYYNNLQYLTIQENIKKG